MTVPSLSIYGSKRRFVSFKPHIWKSMQKFNGGDLYFCTLGFKTEKGSTAKEAWDAAQLIESRK